MDRAFRPSAIRWRTFAALNGYGLNDGMAACQPAGIPAAADYPDFETLKRRWTEIESDLLAYVASLRTERS